MLLDLRDFKHVAALIELGISFPITSKLKMHVTGCAFKAKKSYVDQGSSEKVGSRRARIKLVILERELREMGLATGSIL